MPLTPNPEAAIVHIHAVFCSATGIQLRLGIGEYNRQAAWFRFLQAGFTSDDLVTTIRYLQREIKLGRRNPGALLFRNLIERLDIFEEDAALARGALRNAPRQPTPRERVVAQARPTAFQQHDTTNTAKPIGEYVQRALAELRRVVQ